MTKATLFKPVAMLCVLATVLSFTSCKNEPPSASFFRFAYAGGEQWSEDYLNVTEEEIGEYASPYADAMSDHYKSALGEKEQYIYNAVSYAVDNGYSRIYFPEKYFPEETRVDSIITFYSCDSPFLEHNYAKDGQFALNSISFNNGSNNGMKSYFFDLEHIDQKSTDEKKQAYDFAKEKAASIPKTLKSYNKVLYIYDYVAESIKFADEETYDFDCTAVYEALCGSKTSVCDGFADSLMLLMNVSGIPTYSVEGTNTSGVGHVVNVSTVDSKCFYFDASGDSSSVELGYLPRFFCFMNENNAFSSFTPREEFTSYLPEAKSDASHYFVDLTVKEKDDSYIEKAAKILSKLNMITISFPDDADKEYMKEFGTALSGLMEQELTMSSRNNIAIYKPKKD